MYQEQDMLNEIDYFRHNQSSAQWLFQQFIDSVQESSRRGQKPFASVCVLYLKGISENLKCIGNHSTISTFRTKHTLGSSVIIARPERNPQ
jgi:hypothetical protein